MFSLFTNTEAKTTKALKPCAGVAAVRGQVQGMAQNADHAAIIDPRNPGGPAS